MTFEQESVQPMRYAETPQDFHVIAKATLEAVASSQTFEPGTSLIATVWEQTGYHPADVQRIVAELVHEGVVEGSAENSRILTLTESGYALFQSYDQLMGLDQQ